MVLVERQHCSNNNRSETVHDFPLNDTHDHATLLKDRGGIGNKNRLIVNCVCVFFEKIFS